MAVLPPYNTLWAQVIRVGNPPQIVTDTTQIQVTYHFEDNTYSVGKSNFWDYDQQLFGVDLPPDVGLTGKGLSGQMDVHPGQTHFVAEGIPLTEFRDSAPQTPYPYQLATVTVWGVGSGKKLAETVAVAPVSTEMHCDHCHSDGQQEGIATGSVEKNILVLHDEENLGEGYTQPLVSQVPVLCADCHASNALGKPGVGDIPSLSEAMHKTHQERVSQNLSGCYQCHPGPQTQCLREVMSQREGMDCVDCHGTMADVARETREPWLEEPRCDSAGCHDSGAYDQHQPLYRMSRGHGGVYCAGCHDSPHAVAPSREHNDHIKFLALQGDAGGLSECTVCHAYAPEPPGTGPHGVVAPTVRDFAFGPDHASSQPPGAVVTYTHTLRNTGNLTDTYQAAWTSSRGWAEVALLVQGALTAWPVSLPPGQSAVVQVAITVPATDSVKGLSDTTAVTVTSGADASLVRCVVDLTLVPRAYVYSPLVVRQR
jgi:hypothetical protein